MCELFPFFVAPPCNIPMPGEYAFRILLNDERPVSKTTTFTFSASTQRVYVKKDTVIGIVFGFNTLPPSSTIIRLSVVHKRPELVGENVVCCPKHIEEQKQNGLQNCRHFVRGAAQCQTTYHEDPISGRLSITMPVGSLQQTTENQLQAFYQFPCYTSELKKGVGTLIQIIFTLESSGQVVGRAVVNARVCSSPGRDRELDEMRLQPQSTPPTSPFSLTPSPVGKGRRIGDRKRPQNQECPLSSKTFSQSLSPQKVIHSLETYPAIIPYVNVCVKMMESVYSAQLQIAVGRDDATTSGNCTPADLTGDMSEVPVLISDENTQEQQPAAEFISWLESLQLDQYQATLVAHSITSLSQVVNLTLEDLQRFGITNREHCDLFLRGQRLIQLFVPTNTCTSPMKEGDISCDS